MSLGRAISINVNQVELNIFQNAGFKFRTGLRWLAGGPAWGEGGATDTSSPLSSSTSLASKSSLSKRMVHFQYQTQRAVETRFRSVILSCWVKLLDLESWRRCELKKLNSKCKYFFHSNIANIIGHSRKVQQMQAKFQNNIFFTPDA